MQQPGPLLAPDELDNLVAPVALYLQGTQLADAARQQNWDPSVQALVAFPDALNCLATISDGPGILVTRFLPNRLT